MIKTPLILTVVLVSMFCMAGCSRPAPLMDTAAVSRSDSVYRWADREWKRLKFASDAGQPLAAQNVLDVAEIRWIAVGARFESQIPIGGLLVIDRQESERRLQWCEAAISAFERGERLPPHPPEWTQVFDDE